MEFFYAFLGGSAFTALINGIFGLIRWLMERKAAKEDKRDNKAEVDMKAVLERLDRIEEGQEDFRIALQTDMKDRIKFLARSYIKRGSITTEELEDLIAMHSVYHNQLHGNGFLDQLMAQVKQLPVK